MILNFITARRRALLTLTSSAVLLSACGGFTAVDLGGTISNLTGTGLVLGNGGSTVSPAPGDKTFVFPVQVSIRAPYSVSVINQPARQDCKVFNAEGTAGAAPVTIVAVVCTNNAFAVGGTVTGLTGSGLVLNNGGDRVTIAAGAGSYVFPAPVTDLAAYGVTVLTQPTNGQVCSVANSSAFINNSAVSNANVTCN